MSPEREIEPFEDSSSQRGSSHEYKPPQRTPKEIMQSVIFSVEHGFPDATFQYLAQLPEGYITADQGNELLRSSYLTGAAYMRGYAARDQALGLSGQNYLAIATDWQAAAAALMPSEEGSSK